MAEVAKVYAAVAEVTRAIGRVGIGKRSGGGLKFAYRSIEDVLAAINPLLREHNLVIYPERIDLEPEQTFNTQRGGIQRLVRATITYRFVSTEDGSSFTAQALGEGMDSSDKASGKAMSYAYKYAMFQTFCIPVVGMPDPDADQDTEIAAAPVKSEPAKPSEDLVKNSRAAAMNGMDTYKSYFKALSPEDKKALVSSGIHDQNKVTAKQADESYSSGFEGAAS